MSAFKNFLLVLFLIGSSIYMANAQTLKTPFGVLTVSNDTDLLLNQKQFSPKINGGMSIDFRFSIKYGDKFAVLLAMQSGGRACPSTYQWILLSDKGFEASPEFGNCSEEVKALLAGNDLIVQAPKYGSASAAKYSFNGNQLKENDKFINGKVIAGIYGGGQVEGVLPKPSNQPLNVLFQTGGAWVQDESVTRSNLSCSALLANSNLGLTFERYEPSQLTIQVRVGGKHPNKNNPDVQRMLTRDIRVPIRVENVKVNGNKVIFDRFATNRQGAVMGETYELDTGNKAIRMLKAHTCQKCGEAELRVFRGNQSGESIPRYWCNG